MTCPTCGTEYAPTERFCPRDGSALRAPGADADDTLPAAEPRASARPPADDVPIAHRPSLEDTQFTPVYRRRPARRALPALVAAGVLAVIGAGAVYARRPPAPPASAADTVSAEALEAALARDWARHVEGITPATASAELARAERLIARPRTAEAVRMQAMYVQATSLARLGRHDEGCSTLRRIRDARTFDGMDADFRQRVAHYLVAESGSCQ